MTYETLQYIDQTGTVQEVAFQNLSAAGTSNVEWTPRSLAPSEFVIALPQAPETPLVIPYRSRCIIRACRSSASGANNTFSGGTILFQGRRTDVSASASGGQVSTVITISDVFWDLAQLTYKVGWQVPTSGTIGAPVYTTEYSPDIVMFQADPIGQLQPNGSRAAYAPAPYAGYLITDWQQLMGIIYYAINYATGGEAVQLQMGTVAEFTTAYRSTDTARSIKCIEVIKKCLQAHPTGRSWIDHTTTPPTLHFTDTAHRAAVTLPYRASDPSGRTQSHEATDIQPLPHLKPDRVTITYKVNGSLNGTPVVSFASDIYPAAGGPFLQTQDYSVDISGVAQTLTQKNFTSAAFDPTSLTLWRARVASLKQVSQGGQIPNDGSPGALSINLASITVVDANGNPIDYEDTYIYWTDQSVYAWFEVDGAPAEAVKATVKALFTYNKNNTLTPNQPEQAVEHAHTFRIMLTTAPSGVYSTIQTTNGGETAPPNLAQNIFTDLATLQWKVSHKIWQVGADANTVPALVLPGRDAVNLTGGDPAWLTMAAQIDEVSIKLVRVLVAGVWKLLALQTIRCGPINFLEPGYYVQLWNMFANRNIRNIPVTQRLNGLPSQLADLTATEASENSAPAVATMSVQDIVGVDTTNPVGGGAQILIQPNAPTGQIPVLQQTPGGATTHTTGIIAPAYHGVGAPSATTLPAGTYYRTFDRYFDTTAPGAPVEYLCNSAGTNSTSIWAEISGGGGGGANYYVIYSLGNNDYVGVFPLIITFPIVSGANLLTVNYNPAAVPVAKHNRLRPSLSSEIIDGVTINYTMYTLDNTRQASDGTNTEWQVAFPRYSTIQSQYGVGLGVGGSTVFFPLTGATAYSFLQSLCVIKAIAISGATVSAGPVYNACVLEEITPRVWARRYIQ